MSDSKDEEIAKSHAEFLKRQLLEAPEAPELAVNEVIGGRVIRAVIDEELEVRNT